MRAIAAIPPYASRPNSWPNKTDFARYDEVLSRWRGEAWATPDRNNTRMGGKGNRSPVLVKTHRNDTLTRLAKNSVSFNDDCDDECVEAMLNRAQADLHRTLNTVLATGDQSLAVSHRSASELIREAQTLVYMGSPKSLWQKQLDA